MQHDEHDEVGRLLPQPPRKSWTYSSCGFRDSDATSTDSGALRFYVAADATLLPNVGNEAAASSSSSCGFMSDALCRLKQELNATKGLLSGFDIGKWSAHTSRTQPCGDVVAHVAREYNAELCTNAWCKMYEILASFRETLPEWTALSDHSSAQPPPAAEPGGPPASAENVGSRVQFLPPQRARPLFASVHLCEAPGAFICALNHFMKTEGFEGHHNWLASTLNPWYEGNKLDSMVSDDRFILHTKEHWSFGCDQTGDLLVLENLRSIASDARSRLGHAMLVTADGSFDCQDEPAEQERLVYPLLAAELYCALLVIAEGGSLVLKMFTAFETATTVLIYFLTTAFNSVTIFKPMTSKPGNSELYVVCSGYRCSANWMTECGDVTEAAATAFQGAIQHGLPILDPSFVPAAFLTQHVACCQAFKAWQDETILSNIRLYKMSWSLWRLRARERREQCCLLYDELCQLKPISDDNKITGSRLCDDGSGSNKSCASAASRRRRLSGSYEERVLWSGMSWEQYVSFIGFYDVPASAAGRWVATAFSQNFPCSVVSGKRLQAIGSSRFCDQELVAELSRFVQHAFERESEAALTSQATGAGLNDDAVQLVLTLLSSDLLSSDTMSVSVKETGDIEKLVGNTCATAVNNRLIRIDTDYDWLELGHRSYLLEALLRTLKLLRCLPEAEASCVAGFATGSGGGGCDGNGRDSGDDPRRHQCNVVVLPFSTLLTRFSVSCLYVLWSCFAEVSCLFSDSSEFGQRPAGPLLHLCCRGPVLPAVAAGMESQLLDVYALCSAAIGAISSTLARSTAEVLEFVPVTTLLADEKFVSFVLTANRLAVKRLINWLLAREHLALANASSDDGV